MPTGECWPDLHVARWAGTKRSLHLYAQMLGKIRVSLSPAQPNWMFTRLHLNVRGLTTGFVPLEAGSIEASIDVFDSTITVARSDGKRETIALMPPRSIARVYTDLSHALEALHVDCVVSTIPQEIPDTTPMHEDHRTSEYVPASVQQWFHTATSIATIFESWRSRFFGRSGIQVWWGALDVALILFSGKKVSPPTDRGYLMKYDLDAELMNVGFYLGDEQTAPFFYGYIYPEPKGAETLSVAHASWSPALREWILPYDDVRAAAKPEATIESFIDDMYELCFTAAGWNRGAYTYDAPKHRGS